MVAGNAEATVSWSAPASDGGSAITGYTVVTVEDTSKHCATSSGTSCTVGGLINGTAYTFIVTVVNSVGLSPASMPSAPAIPRTLPGAPTGVTATMGNGQATISWSAPASDGGSAIIGYAVAAVEDTSKHCATSSATSCTITGLANGMTYTFTIAAANAVGSGPVSLPSTAGTPATIPGAPTDVTGTTNDSQATISWNAPISNGGSVILEYSAVAVEDTGKHCVATSAPTCVINGLEKWTSYSFRVTAKNSIGFGPASSPSAPVFLSTVPSPPLNPSVALVANGSVSVQWAASASNGGSPATYQVTASPGAATCAPTGSTLKCGISGLANGTEYTFAVKATNTKGSSAASAVVGPVVPMGWTQQISGTDQHLLAAAWSGTQWAVAGAAGTLLTSPDGFAWTPQASGTARNLNAVAWGGGQWVAAGDTGTLLTSTDGVNWVVRNSGTISKLKAAAWAGGKWVVVGDQGTILTSTDGVVWGAQNSGVATTLNSVTASGSLWVAVGGGAKILTSSNTEDWSSRSIDVPPADSWLPSSLSGSVWTGAYWAAVGVSYKQVLVPASGGSQHPNNVIAPNGHVLISSDGISWAQALKNGRQWDGASLAWIGSRLILTPRTNRINAEAMFGTVVLGNYGATSLDGVSWPSLEVPFNLDNGKLNGLSSGNGQVLAVGNSGVIYTSP